VGLLPLLGVLNGLDIDYIILSSYSLHSLILFLGYSIVIWFRTLDSYSGLRMGI